MKIQAMDGEEDGDTVAQTEADADADAEVKPNDTVPAGAADEATEGLMAIAKQLVGMADSL